ncbi:MAG: peptide chain release factor N(5)-glutamine methyltransferase [Acidimicrobiia bacterium]
MTTWADARRSAESRLRAACQVVGVEAPESEARWMVERVSGYDGVELVVAEHEEATGPALAELDEMLERRLAGEPLQYVLGRWQFLGLELFVDRRVLVPRPETEVVAQVALAEAARLGLRRGRGDPWSGTSGDDVVLDLGTGSGALALALASELRDVAVWAVDVSEDALAVARANVAGAGGTAAPRVRVAAGSWFDALPDTLRGSVRVIVSNPPYVAEHEVASLPASVIDWEPYGALVSGPTGMEAIEVVVAGAREWLAADGVLVCELAPHQADHATGLAHAAGFAEVAVRPDLSGRDRVLVARTRPDDRAAG